MNCKTAKNIYLFTAISKFGCLSKYYTETYDWYNSPLRNEPTLLLKICTTKNVQFDHGKDRESKIINLINEIKNCSGKGVFVRFD